MYENENKGIKKPMVIKDEKYYNLISYRFQYFYDKLVA